MGKENGQVCQIAISIMKKFRCFASRWNPHLAWGFGESCRLMKRSELHGQRTSFTFPPDTSHWQVVDQLRGSTGGGRVHQVALPEEQVLGLAFELVSLFV